MRKTKVKVPKYTDRKHSSELALQAQRMPSRTYKDKKKESSKRQCRTK